MGLSGGDMSTLKELEWAIDELEQEKDKSLEEHLYALRKVLQKASDIHKELNS
jgi:hypothetical protein